MSFGATRVAPEKAVFRPALSLSVQPEFTGEHAMATTYKEQLLHPSWQRKRLEVLNAANFTCQACGTAEKTLHVHHKQYVKGRKVWEYELDELQALCADCHKEAHDAKDLIDRLLAQTPVEVWPRVASLLVGYLTEYVDDAFWLETYGQEWARHGEIAAYLNDQRAENALELRDLVININPDRFLELMRGEVDREIEQAREGQQRQEPTDEDRGG